MRRVIVAVVGCVSVVIGSRVGSGQDAEPAEFGSWSEPVNLGPTVNTSLRDTGASISRDGLSLYFDSGNDLYVSHRHAVDLPWETPAPLEMLNSPESDGGASLSSDNRSLFFVSRRTGNPDIWLSQRRFTHDDFGWEPPVRLPAPPNTTGQEQAPHYVENPGRTPHLYYTSGTTVPTLDLYVTERREDGTWSTPENLVVLNSAVDEGGPAVRFDGLELILASRRDGDLDLYVSRRSHTWEPWSVPEHLGEILNTPSAEFTPHLSPNGRTLYFSSSRPGGFGNFDIYASTRQRIR